MLILVDNLQVLLLSNCAYYLGAKPGKKHALNSELCLLTYAYGISHVRLHISVYVLYVVVLGKAENWPCT